jgi:hypothetical protein
MKKLFLLLLTLASTNVLFGVRPHNATLNDIRQEFIAHLQAVRGARIARQQAAPNAAQLGHFRLVQAPQAQRANRAPASHLIPTIFPINLPQFGNFQLEPAHQAQRGNTVAIQTDVDAEAIAAAILMQIRRS